MSIDSDPVRAPATVERAADTVLPTKYGLFRMIGYLDAHGAEHVALVRGENHGENGEAPLVRVHSECLTGDALGSWRCDCGEQLDAALRHISEQGSGLVIYVRGHEGRGIGLLAKLRAYALQDEGIDTVDANTSLGLPVDSRTYNQAAEILQDLGITRVRLLSSNPAKQEALEELGVEVVERRRLAVAEHAENASYLATKRSRMRHDPAPAADVWEQLLLGQLPATTAPGEAEELLHRYGFIVEHGPRIVLGQLGQSLDGFIASRTGDAEYVTGSEDREHLHRLRALSHAVVVGAGTVVSDDCRLTVRAVPGPNPVRVVLDPHARVPLASQVMNDGDAPTLWLVGPQAEVPGKPAAHVTVLRMESEEHFEPSQVLRLLRSRGLGRVLVEGGGRTVSRFLAEGVLDRLFLTTAPILVGDGIPGIRFSGTDALSGALSAPVRRFVFGRDVCTEFNLGAAAVSNAPVVSADQTASAEHAADQ